MLPCVFLCCHVCFYVAVCVAMLPCMLLCCHVCCYVAACVAVLPFAVDLQTLRKTQCCSTWWSGRSLTEKGV